jgi:predicted amidophosphoribosyltransferase
MGVLDFIRTWLFPPACIGCEVAGSALCAACAPGPHAALAFEVDGVPAFALGPYDGALRRAIIALKHGARDPLDAFAALLEHAPAEGTLVPLPTTRGRAAARGFDQSVVLARRLAARRGLVCTELLAKHGRAQAGRGRGERLAARGRFGLRAGVPLPREVTLIDDVCTTGATLRDALWTLRDHAVEVRRIIVVARAADDRRLDAEPGPLRAGQGG